MADYRFLTTWIVDAPIDAAWEIVHAIERWPEWWPGVRSADELRAGEDGVLAAPLAPSRRARL